MRLSRLLIRHFRNLGEQELDLPSEGVAIIGQNAQGKTNLLEAVYYLETLRSFRGARDDRLVAFGREYFRVAARLEEGPVGRAHEGGAEVAAAFQRQGRRKKVTLNGEEPQRLGDALGRLAAVVFSPSDVGLVTEGPGARRRFLDIVLSLNQGGYLADLQRFRHILGQRNAALKDGGDPGMVAIWNPGLAESGARVMAARLQWVKRWGEAFSRYYRRVSGSRSASMAYRPGLPMAGAESVEELEAALGEALRDSRQREQRMGNTLVGPHRDELLLTVEEEGESRELREFGSGGQRRTAALALRLVEAATVREARGQEPIILLDDVFAELDPERSERILSLMEEEETGQVLLTAPKESDVRLRRDRLPRWRIRGGRVES